MFGVSLRLQMQEVSTRGTRRFSLLLLLLRLKSNRTWSSLRRVHPMKESPAPLVVILRTNLSQFTVSTIGLFEGRDKFRRLHDASSACLRVWQPYDWHCFQRATPYDRWALLDSPAL